MAAFLCIYCHFLLCELCIYKKLEYGELSFQWTLLSSVCAHSIYPRYFSSSSSFYYLVAYIYSDMNEFAPSTYEWSVFMLIKSVLCISNRIPKEMLCKRKAVTTAKHYNEETPTSFTRVQAAHI